MWRKLLMLVIFLLPSGQMARADGCFVPATESAHFAAPQQIHEPEQRAAVFFRGGVEDLVLSVSYQGATGRFAWIVPTPTRPTLGRAPSALFHKLEREIAERTARKADDTSMSKGGRMMAGAVPPVTVIERKQVGIYDATVLQATSAKPLLDWLRANRYYVSKDALSAFDFYVHKKWYFVAMRIDLRKSLGKPSGKSVAKALAQGGLQAIRLTFRSPHPIYPLRISAANPGVTKVALYVIASGPAGTNRLTRTFCEEFHSSDLNRMTESRPSVPVGHLWVTRLEQAFTPEQMRDDVTIAIQPPSAARLEPF